MVLWLVGASLSILGILVWVIDYDATHGWKEFTDSYSNEFDK